MEEGEKARIVTIGGPTGAFCRVSLMCVLETGDASGIFRRACVGESIGHGAGRGAASCL